jgi:hypothetical protein
VLVHCYNCCSLYCLLHEIIDIIFISPKGMICEVIQLVLDFVS